MKIITNSEDGFTLFFNKMNNIDLKDNIEEEFKNIFLKLKNYYNINVYGFYNVIVYVDNNYGIILDVIKDKELDLFYNQIDMHIIIEKNSLILYKVDDIFFVNNDIINNINLYYYNNNFYIEIINKLYDNDMLKLIENSNILYGNDVKEIKNKLTKLIMSF